MRIFERFRPRPQRVAPNRSAAYVTPCGSTTGDVVSDWAAVLNASSRAERRGCGVLRCSVGERGGGADDRGGGGTTFRTAAYGGTKKFIEVFLLRAGVSVEGGLYHRGNGSRRELDRRHRRLADGMAVATGKGVARRDLFKALLSFVAVSPDAAIVNPD